ncbi:hypothetical protein JG688_00012509, partial [Phytophthora aleatoria]
WNVKSYDDSDVPLQNRTKNPIESYNCAIKRLIGESHPEILMFDTKLKQQAARYLQMCDDTSMERCRAPLRSDKVTFTVPAVYRDFKVRGANCVQSQQKQGKTSGKEDFLRKICHLGKALLQRVSRLNKSFINCRDNH